MRAIGTSVAVCAFFILIMCPMVFLNDITKDKKAYMYAPGESSLYSWVEISETGGTYYQKISDTGKVNNIYMYLDNLMKTGEKDNTTYGSGDYSVTFTNKYGNKLVYTLDNNTLVCQQTKRRIVLTDEQLLKLKEVLNLTA